jgi:hypothetical protein
LPCYGVGERRGDVGCCYGIIRLVCRSGGILKINQRF